MSDRDDLPANPVNRRTFVGSAVAGAIALRGGGALSATIGAPQVPAFALEELTIDDLQARMRDGRDTSESLVRQYLARIEAIDQRGPAINAVIELNPDAPAIAARLDAERKAGKVRGPRETRRT